MIRILFIILTFILFQCTNSPRYGASATSKKTLDPKSFKTMKRVPKVITGISSYYGTDFHGKLTANGEVYDMYGLTAAHKTLPLNTWIKVTNLDRLTKPSIKLKINDRGPYVGDRVLDCSYGAAKKLGFFNKGTANVKIEVIKWGDNKYHKH